MEGRRIVIESSEELNLIDGEILNALCYGIDVHILSTRHVTCEGDQVTFTNYINNCDVYKRVIYITDNMIDEFETIESVYYSGSRQTMDPCPSDPLDHFKWYCPLCKIDFDNM